MNETSKAMARRAKEKNLWKGIFHGDVCDVGPEMDPLTLDHLDCRLTTVQLPDGGGDKLQDSIGDMKFDCIHGSQVLEHAKDPVVMLGSWIDALREGGHIVATVPSWELYEHRTWPSKWNAGHRSTWSMNETEGDSGWYGERYHAKLPDWLYYHFGPKVKVVLCRLVDTNYDYNDTTTDQTFDASKGVECFIEFVLKKI